MKTRTIFILMLCLVVLYDPQWTAGKITLLVYLGLLSIEMYLFIWKVPKPPAR
jgi:hypothetical protein